MKFNDVLTEEKYKAHQLWIETDRKKGERLNLSNADLRYANLTNANLRRADLTNASLADANLTGANLTGAYLFGADLRDADLFGADLRGADLRRANMFGADLRGADLSGANIDLSCWPLRCSSFDATVDKNIVAQLVYHVCRLNCDDEEVQKAQHSLKELASQFHRVGKGVAKP
jgi:hypothetical protein